jgi:GMP reductase
MRVENEILLDFKDVLIRPKRSTLASRKDVNLYRKYTFKWSEREWTGLPIMAANMDGVGTFAMAAELCNHGMFTCLVKSYNTEDWNGSNIYYDPTLTAISTGISVADYTNLKNTLYSLEVAGTAPEFICIDVANGYSEHFGDFVAKIRKEYPHKTIIAGNVVTADMTQELILRGADIVKVGIGPGSVCTTRIQTGVGYPQLSAIIDCADAAHGLGGHIIADGGCTCPGDVAKAFGGGADFVMLGGMLAGHNEGGGTIIEEYYETNQLKSTADEFRGYITDVKRFVEFYGMSSGTAMEKNNGGIAEYRSSEGRTVRVPYRGPVKQTVLDILGGLRSTCTYVGAPSLKQLSKCTTFIRVNSQFNGVFARN